jgi:protein SCO1/2
MNRRAMTIRTALFLALSLALSACGRGGTPAEKPPLEGAAIGGPFTLKDKAGRDVRWGDFAGKYRIVYFGYTFCPDACPMDVSTTMRGFNQFAKDHPDLAAQVQPIFITLDPARDTPARVGEFAAAFSPRLLGLTGTPEQIAQAARAFVVVYGKGKETGGGYLMDHTRNVLLMDREGKPLAMLPADKQDAKAVAAELAKWVT